MQITMKPACATFSDSRHAVQTTKISFPTQTLLNQNWTTKSLLFRKILLKASTIPTYEPMLKHQQYTMI